MLITEIDENNELNPIILRFLNALTTLKAPKNIFLLCQGGQRRSSIISLEFPPRQGQQQSAGHNQALSSQVVGNHQTSGKELINCYN